MRRPLQFALATMLASCLGPPAVAPTQTLAIDHAASGPRTRGQYAVVFAGPRGTVENRTEPGVTVLFNRTMRTLDDEGHVPPLTVRTDEGANIAGKWQWIGTHGLLFVPDADLPGSTHFKVVVPRGTASLEGDTLAADYSLVFTTSRPQMLASSPGEGATTLRSDASIRIDFNQPIDPTELARVAHLVARTSDDPVGKTVPFAVTHPDPTTHPSPIRFASGGDHPERAVLITPQQRLPLDAAIEVDIGKGLKGEGPLTMEQAARLHVRTYGPLRLTQVTCPRVFDSTLGKCQAHRDVTVALSNEVMPDEFRTHVAFGTLPKTPPSKIPVTRKTPPRPQVSFVLGADPDFDKRYRVTLKAGMTDIYGQRLAKDVAFDLDTEPPFSQTSTVVTRPPQHEDSEEPAPEKVAARAIPPFEVGFGIDGYVLEAGLALHNVPVGLVNVPTFGLVTRKLDVRETKQYLSGLAVSPGGFLSGGYRFAWETPDPAANTRIVRSVDLDALLAPTRRGTVLLALGTPAQIAPLRQQLVSLTDLGVTAKMSKFGSLVWVTSLSTGKALPGAQVAVGIMKKDDQQTFVTDDQGIALIPPDAFAPIHESQSSWGGEYASPDTDWLVVVSKGTDWTYARVEQSPSFMRAAPHVDLGASKEWQGTVFADRGVYRPGETVKLAAVLRQADARGLSIVEGRDVRVTVDDSQGNKVFESRGKLDAFGAFTIDATLPKTTHLGSATATLTLAQSHASFSASMLVADFKPVEFAVAAQADKRELVRGDRAHFTVHGEYLFHAPMAKAAAHDTAVRSVTSFTPKGSDGYVTSDEAFTSDYGDKSPRAGELLENDAALDAAGDHDVSLDLPMPGQLQPELVSFESEVEDFTRQVVTGAASVLVHPAEFYLAMKRPASRFVAVGATLRPEMLALRPDGTHVPGANVKLELVLRKWNTVVEDTGDGSRRSTVEDTTVAACDVATAAVADSCALRVPEAGYFIVRATAKDARGNAVRASTALYSLSDKPDVPVARIGWSEGDTRVVKLESDKASYEPGETAKILVRNPFKEAEALVTVERGGVLTSHTTTLRGPMPLLSIPIQDEYFPNVFVSVHVVRGRVQAPPTTGADVSGPDYRDGYVELGVSPHTHRLDVEVKPDSKEHRPGDDLDADVIVKDAKGQPIRSELTFYVVDEGVLMLTDYKTPDPLAAFTRPRSLAVFGMENRDHLAKITALKAGERLHNLGWQTRGGDKGDDGGGGDESGGGGKPRRDFKNTAYFEAGRVTGADGKAHFHFKLPDNLTSFRLMAVAASLDRFGSGQANVTSSKRLMARPALPRAIRVGDKLDASVVISGKSLGETAVDVRMTVSGGALAITGAASQHVTLPASGNIEVHFPIVAQSAGDVNMTFAVSGKGERDTVEVRKHVALPLHLESTAVYGETTKAAAIALGDLSKIRSDQGSLDVRLSSSALVGLSATFDELDQYPYGCTEQLASRMIPLLALDDLARSVGVRVPAASDARLQDAVASLLTHQKDSGGFGFWDNDPEEGWLSAYALLALDAASRRNFYVPHDALDNGVEYLRKMLAKQKAKADTSDGHTDQGSAEGEEEKADPEAAYAGAAFVADVLATLGKPDPGYLNELYDTRIHQPLFAQALLLHAMAVAGMPKSQLSTLTSEVTARLRIDADSAVAEEQGNLLAPLLDSTTRTTAMVLRALLVVDPLSPFAPRLAKGLLMARKSGAWATTQENAWALVALDAYRRAQESTRPNFDVTVFLGSARIGDESFHDSSLRDDRISLIPSKVKARGGPLTFAMTGAGKLYYSAELKYEIADLPKKPLDRGLFVQKTMRAVKLADLAQATQWIPKKTALSAQAGDLVVVDLLLESAEPQEQVVIEDPLPAGLEAIDFDFATTGRTHEVSDRLRTDRKPPSDALDSVGMPFREAQYHRELKDDRVLTFIPHVQPGMYHFRYLARATVVGTYVVPPTSAACMYSPEIFGRTQAESFEVRR